MNPPSAISRRYIPFSAAVSLSLIGACSDRDPTGPPPDSEPPSLTVYSNGGAVPEVIITYPDSITETLLFTFTKAPPPQTGQIDGSSYGVDFGHPGGTEYPRGNAYWDFHPEPSYNVVNLPSPGYAASAMYAPHQAFIEFDPPVRAVEFYYAAMNGSSHPDFGNSIPVKAYTSNFWLVDQVTIPTNGSSWPLEVWDLAQLSSPTDQISWLWIDGSLYIDDLKITRAPACGTSSAMSSGTAGEQISAECPTPIEMSCGFAIRGETATCTVTDARVDSVTKWVFLGHSGGDPMLVVDDSSKTSSWSGQAVLEGLVTATVWVDDEQRTASDSLAVIERPWRWSFDDYDDYLEGTLHTTCISWEDLDVSELPVTVGINAAIGPVPCEPGAMLLPSPFSNPLGGFDVDTVMSGGPNAGLYYIGSANYHSTRGSRIHPQLDPSAAQNPIPKCKKSTQANWYQYNDGCKNFNADGFIEGIWDHEGRGSQGNNGHQSLFEAAAGQTVGDPEHRIEGLVHEIEGELWIDVQDELLDTNIDLFNAVDVHPMLPSNFCSGFIWIYKQADSKFEKFRLGNDPGEFQCP